MSKAKKLIRQKFRNQVLTRDKHRCRICGISGVPLDPHHIENRETVPDGGYTLDNGISLCEACHVLAEKAWYGEEAPAEYFPAKLLERIKQ